MWDAYASAALRRMPEDVSGPIHDSSAGQAGVGWKPQFCSRLSSIASGSWHPGNASETPAVQAPAPEAATAPAPRPQRAPDTPRVLSFQPPPATTSFSIPSGTGPPSPVSAHRQQGAAACAQVLFTQQCACSQKCRPLLKPCGPRTSSILCCCQLWPLPQMPSLKATIPSEALQSIGRQPWAVILPHSPTSLRHGCMVVSGTPFFFPSITLGALPMLRLQHMVASAVSRASGCAHLSCAWIRR